MLGRNEVRRSQSKPFDQILPQFAEFAECDKIVVVNQPKSAAGGGMCSVPQPRLPRQAAPVLHRYQAARNLRIGSRYTEQNQERVAHECGVVQLASSDRGKPSHNARERVVYQAAVCHAGCLLRNDALISAIAFLDRGFVKGR